VTRIAIIVSSPITAKAFLTEQINALSGSYQVCLVLNLKKGDSIPNLNPKVEVVAAPIVRNISVLRDLHALLFLVALFSRRKFDAVHSVSPKAGLLAMLAGKLARVPVRIHTFTGQVWATRAGFSRMLLKNLDRLLVACATHVLVDSHSQKEFLLRERVVTPGKASVLAEGSISGVDTTRFRPDLLVRKKVRSSLNIPQDATVFVYVGRLKRDKGVLDLAAAFLQLCRANTNAYLLVVGPDEENLRPQIESRCDSCIGRLRFVDWTRTPEQYMASADVLCLPSYREGFGSVVIEAAACEVPSLASRIYGVTDAVVEGVTGVLHEPGNVEDLACGMARVVENPARWAAMGRAARVRAEKQFAADTLTAAVLQYYRNVLG
jgi:glycosyltransferase involved in cell wall biosynthesis